MKRTAILTALLLAVLPLSAQQQEMDSGKLYTSVTGYLKSLLTMPVDTISSRVDELVGSLIGANEIQKAQVAGIAFDFFNDSPYMGHEAVAIHIVNKWFLNGPLEWPDPAALPLLRTMVEFNKSSLIGCEAQPIEMEDANGLKVSVLDVPADHKVLYFYDASCSTCKQQTPLLAELINSYKGESLAVFAIYTQADKDEWDRYVAEHFTLVDNPNVKVYHLWDPEGASSYHKKYGVLSTPAMLLLDDQNRVTGRRLDCDVLAQLLDVDLSQKAESYRLFDQLFDSRRPLNPYDACIVADIFAERALQGDSSLFRSTIYTLYEYLSSSGEYELQQGAYYIAEKYILLKPEYWSSQFTDSVLHGLAMAKLNPVGRKAADLILQNKRGKDKRLLDCAGQYQIVFFHLADCKNCQAEAEALRQMELNLQAMNVSVTMVYAGDDAERWKEFRKNYPTRWIYLADLKGTSRLHELYDIEYVPKIYLLDSNGIVIAKDMKADQTVYMLHQL